MNKYFLIGKKGNLPSNHNTVTQTNDGQKNKLKKQKKSPKSFLKKLALRLILRLSKEKQIIP